METTERIVEAYCRYIKDLFTISNIPCKSHEIDIVAVKLSNKHFQKYHIEVSISNTRPYAKLIHKDTPPNHKAKEKRTIEYFIAKFNNPDTINKLDSIGFKTNKYKKVIVTNGWDKSVEEIAKKNNIKLWNFDDILIKISDFTKSKTNYFKDDSLRTLQLFTKALNKKTVPKK